MKKMRVIILLKRLLSLNNLIVAVKVQNNNYSVIKVVINFLKQINNLRNLKYQKMNKQQ